MIRIPIFKLFRTVPVLIASSVRHFVPRAFLFPTQSKLNDVCADQRRWKTKKKTESNDTPKKNQIPPELLDFIKDSDMHHHYSSILSRFQTNMQNRLALKVTPQILADLAIPEAHCKLGQIANLVLQRQQPNAPNSSSDQTLLIDLTGHPEYVSSVRKTLSHFLDGSKAASGSQLQNVGPSTFTVRLRTVITREARNQLIHLGSEMANQVKREMDRVYQMHDKLIQSNTEAKKRFSEDSLFLTRNYLRATVKAQHLMATTMWEQKQSELKAD